jgi:hypothetical protein
MGGGCEKGEGTLLHVGYLYFIFDQIFGSGMIAAKSVSRFSGGYVEITSFFLLRLFSNSFCTLFYIAAFYTHIRRASGKM